MSEKNVTDFYSRRRWVLSPTAQRKNSYPNMVALG